LARQIDQKKEKAEQEFKKELEQNTLTAALLDEKNKQFYSYAERAIKQWQDNGKTVTPLIVELKSYKKKIF
jgi:23S rRNA pseudoU1915 N3-methylase RlmH